MSAFPLIASLRFRVLVGGVVIVLTLFGIFGYNNIRVLQELERIIVETEVRQLSETLNLALSPNTTSDQITVLQDYFKELIAGDEKGIVYIALLADTGEIAAQSEVIPQPLPQPTRDFDAAINAGVIHIAQPMLVDNKVGTLRYGLSTQMFRDAKVHILKDSLLLLTVTIMLVMMFLILLGMRFNARIVRLMNASQALANGDYQTRAPQKGADELSQLAVNFNLMAESVTARQSALEASEHRMRATLENTPNVAIQWFDTDGIVVLWNSASEEIYGIPAELAIGKSIETLIYHGNQAETFRRILHTIQITGEPIGPYHAKFLWRDHTAAVFSEAGELESNPRFDVPPQTLRYLLCTTFAISWTEQECLFANMAVDVSQQKQIENELEERVFLRTRELAKRNEELSNVIEQLELAQDKLVHAEKLACLGGIVAGVAHELNTPIGNALMVATSFAEKTKQFNAEAKLGLRKSLLDSYMQHSEQASVLIDRNLRRAAELITSFKRVAVDQTSSNRRRFDLLVTMNELLATIYPALKKTVFTIELAIPSNIELDSYPGPLGQVISNLVNNAMLHAFAEDFPGKMRLQAEIIPGYKVKILFSDNGMGIPTANLNRIFDPFFTTKLGLGGSGLGLSIVHNIVTGVLGGEIVVRSVVDQGTVFELLIPLSAPNVKN